MNKNLVLAIIAAAALAAIGIVAVGVAAVVVLTRRPTPAVVAAPPVTMGGSTTPTPPTPTPTPRENSNWRQDALRSQLRLADEAVAKREEAMQRLGALSEAEQRAGVAAVELIKHKGIGAAGPDVRAAARRVVPRLVDSMEREEAMESGAYQERARRGEVPERLPAAERRELMRVFRNHLGLPPSDWSLSAPFDQLSAAEMRSAVAVAERAGRNGFRTLGREEIDLLAAALGDDDFRGVVDAAGRRDGRP